MSNTADPVAELASVGDPALRARLATAVNRHLAALMRAVFEVRDAAVVECRPHGSVTEVATQVGLSRSRVQQVAGAKRPTPECAAPPTLPSAAEPLVPARSCKTAGGADLDLTVSTDPNGDAR